jgi:hypothetical protein
MKPKKLEQTADGSLLKTIDSNTEFSQTVGGKTGRTHNMISGQELNMDVLKSQLAQGIAGSLKKDKPQRRKSKYGGDDDVKNMI